MSFLLSLFSMMTVFEAKVEWVWDFIEIPLFESIEEYRFLPEAKLYIDGFLIVDADVMYTRNGVERTFISTVNTSNVRQYTIYYKATFPDYSISSTHPIVFSVVDIIPPIIYEIPEKTMMVGGVFPIFEEGISYGDNYDELSELTLSFQTSHITKNIVGTYHYGVIVTDRSGNQTKKVGVLYIVDWIPPVIRQKEEIVIDIFSSWSVFDFFDVSDNADAFVQIILDDQEVDYLHVGSYPLSITGIDDSGNMTKIHVEMKIIDRTPPTLILVPVSPIIDVFTLIDSSLLKSFVLMVDDNYDHLTVDDIEVIGMVNTAMIGTYRMTYQLKDSSMNQVSAFLDIKVQDRMPPVIQLLKSLVVEVFSVEPFWIEYFEFYDAYSTVNELNYQLVTKPDMDEVGFYPLTLTVTDKSGNKAIYQSFIEIVDQTPPEIIQLNDIIITDFEKHDYIHYFDVFDQYDDDDKITLTIDDKLVNYEIIGEYPLYLFAMDQSGNQTSFLSSIWIIDIIEPVLTLSEESVFLPFGSEVIDLKNFIEEAYDNYDSLTHEDVVIHGEVNEWMIGIFEITYELTDDSGNQAITYVTIIIDDKEPPTMEFDDLFYIYGEQVEALDGLVVNDNYATPQVICLNQNINDYLPGRYVLTYVVIDQRGNYRLYERTLIIAPLENQLSIINYLPIGIITLIGLIACLINYRYYK